MQGRSDIHTTKAAHVEYLMALLGVVGVGIGVTDGAYCIRVYVDGESPIRDGIPRQLDGYPVEVIANGRFRTTS